MLPPGLTAQPADPVDHARLQALHPRARTIVRLLVGACSCDLIRPRHPDPREDERHHRERHRRAGATRQAVLAAIERHRRGAAVPAPPGGWPRALAAFVAEHARNAGPTLYLLRFALGPGEVGLGRLSEVPVRQIGPAEAVARPETWLEEDTALVVES